MAEEEVHRVVEMGIQGYKGKYCKIPQKRDQVNNQKKDEEEGLAMRKAQEHELCHPSLVLSCHGASWFGLQAEKSTGKRWRL